MDPASIVDLSDIDESSIGKSIASNKDVPKNVLADVETKMQELLNATQRLAEAHGKAADGGTVNVTIESVHAHARQAERERDARSSRDPCSRPRRSAGARSRCGRTGLR